MAKKTYTCSVQAQGHIIDSLTLPKILDIILEAGATYELKDLKIGINEYDQSYAKLEISASEENILTKVLNDIKKQGATLLKEDDALLKQSQKDKTIPEDFYITTNLPTQIMLNNKWIDVNNLCSDSIIKVKPEALTAHCCKLYEIKKGDYIVTGYKGIKVLPQGKREEKVTKKY